MSGRLIYVMGPSGAGKDAVLQGVLNLMSDGDCHLAPRLVTRPITHDEPHAVSVSQAEFERLEAHDRLALAWRAHGLSYGVLRHIDDRLQAGCDVLVNGSRGYLPEACRRYRGLLPVLLTVDSDLLRQRLSRRGREGNEQINARLERNIQFTALPQHSSASPLLTIDNSGPLDQAITMLYTHLRQNKNRQIETCG
ncbi:phosphonate metabolism protein/1,5-bisphosphokinase (PRPP-forming) PhnN [Pollutimonas harenae]|uniref:Ribose 1,5-bisphosphate phosphokinase PhnN n=1 Tax=Pollutimonas harenae TaxID=657015 RepID=A0A853GYN9_9BURK|nr:phosphonate metabolism protein/1,5-bisphosphokinase (PRPP-forming) PhnN [Pollutimonas harenae]NYT85846.1 phosphonate metabolism protein/1,5-bisphosphokinase (PRPP-forming) PhnN [Pollutimonas harenae]TEA70904.1 phosphonate metabolism protein/1,5-bisphosphokinase (PRPP-forming) PhnN [Pollutimonas harenae]